MRLPRKRGDGGEYDRMVDFVASLQPRRTPSSRVSWGPNGIRYTTRSIKKLKAAAAGVDTVWDLGTINQATRTARINGGIIFHGTSAPVVVDYKDVAVFGGTIQNPAYVVLRYTFSTRTGRIEDATVTALPQPTKDEYIVVLHSFWTSGGLVKHIRQHRNSDIDLLAVAR